MSIQYIDYIFDITPSNIQKDLIDKYLKKCQFIFNQYLKDLKCGVKLPVLIRDTVLYYQNRFPSLKENDLMGFYETLIMANRLKDREDGFKIESYKVSARNCNSLKDIKKTGQIVFPVLGTIKITDNIFLDDDTDIKTYGISKFTDDYYCLKISLANYFDDKVKDTRLNLASVSDVGFKYNLIDDSNINLDTMDKFYTYREEYMKMVMSSNI